MARVRGLEGERVGGAKTESGRCGGGLMGLWAGVIEEELLRCVYAGCIDLTALNKFC